MVPLTTAVSGFEVTSFFPSVMRRAWGVEARIESQIKPVLADRLVAGANLQPGHVAVASELITAVFTDHVGVDDELPLDCRRFVHLGQDADGAHQAFEVGGGIDRPASYRGRSLVELDVL